MTRDEHREQLRVIIGYLVAAYRDQRTFEETVDTYISMLESLPLEDVGRYVKRHIATQKWFPAVSEIREGIIREKIGAPEGNMFPLNHPHPIVRAAVKDCGGASVITENRTFLTAFYDGYAERLANEIHRENMWNLEHCINGVCEDVEDDQGRDEPARLDAGGFIPGSAHDDGPGTVHRRDHRRVGGAPPHVGPGEVTDPEINVYHRPPDPRI